MTLLAFATYGDHAQIISDSMSYRRNARYTRMTSKVTVLPHMDMALASRGSMLIGQMGVLQLLAATETSGGGSFDEITQTFPEKMLQAREILRADWDERHLRGTVFLIGYSLTRRKFDAWQYRSEADFVPERVSGPYIYPAPFSIRPDRPQREYLTELLESAGFQEVPEFMAGWQAQPALVKPRTLEEWGDLALRAYESRALEPELGRVYMGGRVTLTRLEQNVASQMTLLDFPSEGEHFARMMEGSMHPLGQLGPCTCGSGLTYSECHLALALDDPCDCHSGRRVRDCCVYVPEPDEAEAL